MTKQLLTKFLIRQKSTHSCIGCASYIVQPFKLVGLFFYKLLVIRIPNGNCDCYYMPAYIFIDVKKSLKVEEFFVFLSQVWKNLAKSCVFSKNICQDLGKESKNPENFLSRKPSFQGLGNLKCQTMYKSDRSQLFDYNFPVSATNTKVLF